MGDFRISYGRALGQYNNFYARTDGLSTQADTTPDVTNIGLLYTNNTSNTSITYFDVLSPQGNNTQRGWFQGKELRVVFLDDSTTLVRSAAMQISGDSTFGVGGVIDLMMHNSAWLEVGRSENQGTVNATSASLTVTGIVNVAGVKTITLTTQSGSSAILRRALKGDNGDIITVIGAGGSHSLIILNSATAADTFIGTTSASSTQYQLGPGEAISFIKTGTAWLEIRDIVP